MHEIEEDPLFLRVKSRDTVLVGEDEFCTVLSFVDFFFLIVLVKHGKMAEMFGWKDKK